MPNGRPKIGRSVDTSSGHDDRHIFSKNDDNDNFADNHECLFQKDVGRVSASIWMDPPPLYFGFILLCNGNRIETDMKMLLENRDHSSFKAAYKDAKAFRYLFWGKKYKSSFDWIDIRMDP